MEPQKNLWEVVNLRSIALVRATAQTTLRPEALPAEGPQLWIDYKMQARSCAPDALIEVTGALNVKGVLRDSEEPCLTVELEHRLIYGVPDDFSLAEDMLSEFAYTSGIVNLWPYWRELTHSFYRQMDLPLPPLPVYRVGRGVDGVDDAPPSEAARPTDLAPADE